MKLTHDKNYKKNLNFFITTRSKFEIKKLYNIIYKYHIRNKKILFLNVPIFVIKNIKKIIKKSQHFFLPAKTWINGFISNKSTSLYSTLKKNRKKKISKYFLNLKKRSDLVIDFDNKVVKNTAAAIKECDSVKIPIISFKTSIFHIMTQSYRPSYFLSNLSSNLDNEIFYSILKSILKKKPGLEKNIYFFKKDFFSKKLNNNFYKKKNFSKTKNAFFRKKFFKVKAVL